MSNSIFVLFQVHGVIPRRSKIFAGHVRPFSWGGGFVTVFRRRFWFEPVVTVWHREPGDRKVHAVCGSSPAGWRRVVWGARHVRHLKLQVHLLQHLHRWLFVRCGGCGKRFRSKEGVVGGGSGSVLHFVCEELQHCRRTIRDLDAALLVLKHDRVDFEFAGLDVATASRVTNRLIALREKEVKSV